MPYFVAGCIRSVQVQKNPDFKDKMLEYFANLFEDMADFSFEGGKACHGVVLSTMEQDRCEWDDTEQLDRHRRNLAQRHQAPSNDNLRSMPCKFFQDGKCRQPPNHIKRGVMYTHACAKCGGDHATRNCPNRKPKNV